MINATSGRVLEAGVGTGLSLARYKPHLKITGIDLSPEMLERAEERVVEENLTHVEAIREMDAGELEFPDAMLDTAVAMYVMTVVPDPHKVMHELARVTRPGGNVIVVSHFNSKKGLRRLFEKALAPLSRKLGWRPDFPIGTIMVCDDLELVEAFSLAPFGMFTLLRFEKRQRPN
ncbi:MAG: class I SAM-dependent methyltransferase [Hyphomicrobiales bacterium]